MWKEIQQQVASGLATEPMAVGVFHVVLAASAEDRRVQWLYTTPTIAARPEDAAGALDKHLRASLQRIVLAFDSCRPRKGGSRC